jgi:hypothetical protein
MEESDVSFKLVGERTAAVKGNTFRYYIYKVMVKYEDEITVYPAICGSFDINRLNPLIKNDDYNVKVFYDEKFSVNTINKLFDQYIKAIKEK